MRINLEIAKQKIRHPIRDIYILARMKKINVDHILVQSKHEAEDILKLLKEGKDFAELAKKYSSCSSAPNGGALGEVSVQKLNEDFSDAALMLKLGQISAAPVRTKFGYHLIRRKS